MQKYGYYSAKHLHRRKKLKQINKLVSSKQFWRLHVPYKATGSGGGYVLPSSFVRHSLSVPPYPAAISMPMFSSYITRKSMVSSYLSSPNAACAWQNRSLFFESPSSCAGGTCIITQNTCVYTCIAVYC